MSRDDVLKFATQAGFFSNPGDVADCYLRDGLYRKSLEKFASLVESDVLLRVIQRLNQNHYSLTKSECIDVVREMRSTLTGTRHG